MEVVTAKFPKRLQRIIDQKHKQHLPRPSKLVPPIPVEASESSDSESEERDGLGWKPVGRSHLKTGFDDAAVLAFEELDGVDVVYEEQVGRGKVAKLTVRFAYSSLHSVFVLLMFYINSAQTSAWNRWGL